MDPCTTPLLALVAVDSLLSVPPIAAWLATAGAGACILWWVARVLGRGSALSGASMTTFSVVSLAVKLPILAAAMASPLYVPKRAADTALELWVNAREYGASEVLANPTFTLPALVVGPAVELFGPEPAFVAIANCIAVAIGAIVLAATIGRCIGRRPAFWTLVWLTWNPASVYWGLHGLRDPFIFMALCVCAAGVVQLSVPPERHGGIAAGMRSMAVSLLLLLLLRPEVMVIPLGCIAVAGIMLPAARALRPAVAMLVVAMAIAVPAIMRDQVGLESIDVESIEETAHSRLERATRDPSDPAGATNFFEAGDEFLLQDFRGRLTVQFAGLVACPYPVAPRGASDWIVAGESAVWIVALIVPFLPMARRRCGESAARLARTCALCALGGLAMYAPLTVNAGNAFRLRYSLLPLASVGLVLVVAPARRRRLLIVTSAHASTAFHPALGTR
ncbi:MAG: hypothetical protein JNK53_02450 [Phycisphaerae bacterium]|nr:hypothetical protein [Phycisphaerae bacterium]